MRMSLKSVCLVAVALAAYVVVPEAGAQQERRKTSAAKPAKPGPPSAAKKAAVALVDQQRADMVRTAGAIWGFAETALAETRSAAALADYAEARGFTVERGVAGMPTAFVASYGSGRPVIGILAEYDALPGISQKAASTKEALVEGAAGHGCGHNLFGTASLGAAVAIKELIATGKLRGTVRLYGTPAEERIGGKIYMIRDGRFRDDEVILAWHPGDETKAEFEGFQANIQFVVEFHGRTAHAAGDPWNGRSAADAAELFTHGINMLREHVKPSVRMHYTVQKAGDVPNVIPDYARILTWLRDSKRKGVDEVFARVQDIAKGAALMAGVEHTLKIEAGYTDLVILEKGGRLVHDNLVWLGAPEYTEEEQAFARALQQATGKEPKGMLAAAQPIKPIPPDPPGGSSDVGDVSWVAPTLHFSVATAPKDVPWHAWPVVAASGASIGHKGMMYAAATLAATAVDLYEDAALRDAIRAEWAEKTKGVTYRWYIPDGPPPVPAR
jgi:aminobenzoyl-glutamate utilization protein B